MGMIESMLHRERKSGSLATSRVIDIDILFDDPAIDEKGLKILIVYDERKFVLVPLCELASI
ncbi:MAG: 2-amino-4-hydroxy-6-hydroxymethyldihydropteridine diphosphokinase [Bacteroidales bacterium]|nr:2-amino-4-hydroxy-6-hydroxymethyldihydropteridine diphosphokinase [Bacteroidales bacterium]